MRVVKEIFVEDIRVSIFAWNNKYLIKFETGPLEQTYKVSEIDILDEVDLETFFSGDFLNNVKKRFKEMGQNLQKHLENL
ncbi:hypothetical protein [Pararhodonellum marinum]|uniref:hypothetical protein n=1 Tax=Pararhodonellum marinum TaxID=2755358 RepID=UPI0018901298|nr:hypothetical protein [Pararhodonellum marinum]